jgi:Protein of unknown function (DUF3108)
LKGMGGILLSSMLGVAGTADVAAADTDNTGLQPFKAHYIADWKGINVAVSDIDMKPGEVPGQYVYRWSIEARGIFRLAYSDPVIQTSWFKIEDGHVRPDKYRGEEGGKSVNVEFNWVTMRASGTSEDKPLDLSLEAGAQDLNSIQAEIMTDLKNGNLPKTFQILDKDQLKDFDYVQEGTARIRTELGELDTIIVASQRKGNDRVLRMWFAPSLGFIPVQAERTRHGNVEFAMRIKSVTR